MKTILVATDFSATGNNAVKFAIHFSKATKRRLVVFHSARLPSLDPTFSVVDYLKLQKDNEEKQQKRLDLLVNKIYSEQGLKRNNKNVTVLAKQNVFAMEAIVSIAKEYDAEWIITGTHGATGLKLFGSTTSELIFKAEVPVLAIPPRFRYKKINSIVYATDLANTVNELRCIVPIAKELKAAIQVLYLDFGKGLAKPILETQDLVKQVEFKKIEIIAQKEKPELTILEQLVQYLENNKSEMLVMFPEERSLFDKLFVRSKTEQLVYDTKIPLLTIAKSKVVQ